MHWDHSWTDNSEKKVLNQQKSVLLGKKDGQERKTRKEKKMLSDVGIVNHMSTMPRGVIREGLERKKQVHELKQKICYNVSHNFNQIMIVTSHNLEV